MKRTNVTYVKQAYGVNKKEGFVKCILDYEINLDKIPGIEILSMIPKFEDYINSLVYGNNGIKCFDSDYEGIPSEYGVLLFRSEEISFCSNDDNFDETFGKRLALTRAQKRAFNMATRFYTDLECLIEKKFEGIYNLAEGAYLAKRKCREHELDLVDQSYS